MWNEGSQKNLKNFLISGAKLGLSALAIVFLIRSGRLDFSGFSFRNSAPVCIASAAAVFILAMVLVFIRHFLLIKASGVALPLSKVIQAGFVSWFLNATLFGGFGFVSGDAVRIAWLVPLTDKRGALVSATLVDRMMGLLGIVLIAALAFVVCAPQISGNSAYSLVAGWVYGIAATGGLVLLFLFGISVLPLRVMLAFAIVVSCTIYTSGKFSDSISEMWWLPSLPLVGLAMAFFLSRTERLFPGKKNSEPSSWIQKKLSGFFDALIFLKNRPAALGASLLLSLCTHILAVVALYLVSRSIVMTVSPGFSQLFFSAPVASAVGMLPLPANGLGVGETAFDSALRLFRNDSGEVIVGGAALFLAYRVLTIFCGISGLPFFISGKKQQKQIKNSI